MRSVLLEKKYFFVFCAILALGGGLLAVGIALDETRKRRAEVNAATGAAPDAGGPPTLDRVAAGE